MLFRLLIITSLCTSLCSIPPLMAQEKRYSGIIAKSKGPPHRQGHYGQPRDFRSMWKHLHPYEQPIGGGWEAAPFWKEGGVKVLPPQEQYNPLIPSDPLDLPASAASEPLPGGGIGDVGGITPDFAPPSAAVDTTEGMPAPAAELPPEPETSTPAPPSGIGGVGGGIGSVGGIGKVGGASPKSQ